MQNNAILHMVNVLKFQTPKSKEKSVDPDHTALMEQSALCNSTVLGEKKRKEKFALLFLRGAWNFITFTAALRKVIFPQNSWIIFLFRHKNSML